jgi:hypothetical protein
MYTAKEENSAFEPMSLRGSTENSWLSYGELVALGNSLHLFAQADPFATGKYFTLYFTTGPNCTETEAQSVKQDCETFTLNTRL